MWLAAKHYFFDGYLTKDSGLKLDMERYEKTSSFHRENLKKNDANRSRNIRGQESISQRF